MPRGKNRNKDFQKGLQNRQTGIFKKSHTFHRFYPAKIAVIIQHDSGKIGGYQSHRGFLRSIPYLAISEDDLCGPDDFDTVSDRHAKSEKLPDASPSRHTSGSTAAGQIPLPTPPLSGASTSTLESRGTSAEQGTSIFAFPMTPPMTATLDAPFCPGLPTDNYAPVTPAAEEASVVAPHLIFPSSLLPDGKTEGLASPIPAYPPLGPTPTNTRASEPPRVLFAPKPIVAQNKTKLIALAEKFFED